MSAILDSVRTWSARTGGIYTEPQGRPGSAFDERTPQRPLREIAQEQAARLRAVHAPVPARTATERRAAAVTERVQAAVARHGAPVRRPADTAVTATPSVAELYREADRLAAQLPAGRYALPRRERTASGNTITFFQVVEFKSGPRKGTRRIFQLIANGVGLGQQALPPQHQIFAIRHILEDQKAAMALYGQKIGKCGRCNRDLTNSESLAKGIGPECEKK